MNTVTRKKFDLVNLHNFDNKNSIENFDNEVCVRKLTRSGRKHFTTIYGLNNTVNKKDLCTLFRKMCKCGGYVERSDAGKEYIKLKGGHVDIVKNYLLQNNIVNNKQNIKCHG